MGLGRRLWWLLTGPVLAIAATALALDASFDDSTTVAPPTLVDVELALLVGLPLAWRRRRPELVLAVVALATCGIAVRRQELALDVLAVVPALVALARANRRRWLVTTGAAVAGGAAWLSAFRDQGREGGAAQFLWIPFLVLAAVLAGAILRESDRRRTAVEDGPTGSPRLGRTQLLIIGAAALVAVPWHAAVDRSVFGTGSLEPVRWEHRVEGGGIDAAVVAPDGDVLVLAHLGGRAVVARYDPAGQEQWQRPLVDALLEPDGAELAATADGGAAVLVLQRDPIATGLDTDVNTGLLIRLDPQGDTMWEELLAGPVTGLFDLAAGAESIVVAGQRPNNEDPAARPAFVEVFGLDGERRWDATVTAKGSSVATAAAVAADGTVYVGGATNDGDEADAFVRRYQPDGTMVDEERVDVARADVVADLDTAGRTFVVTVIASASSFSASEGVISTIRSTTPDGALRWSRRVEGGRTVEAAAIEDDGVVVFAGNRPDHLVGSWLPLGADLDVGRISADGEREDRRRAGSRDVDLLRPSGIALGDRGQVILVHDSRGRDGNRSRVVSVRPAWD